MPPLPTPRPDARRTSSPRCPPRTGAELARYPVHDGEHVTPPSRAAAEAAAWWDGLRFIAGATTSLRGRRCWSPSWTGWRGWWPTETGKPFDDARLRSILAIDHLDWAAGNAAKVLGKRSVSPGLLMANQAASVAYRPLGGRGRHRAVELPVFTPMGSIAYALAASNTVFKPSS
ncbi:aldehyde dehydrogenase family protein [Pseudonocardia sp. MCCB 268]|nr:aldehyde dehydrogenase family protein [Pseudonocardia cytotoxica]